MAAPPLYEPRGPWRPIETQRATGEVALSHHRLLSGASSRRHLNHARCKAAAQGRGGGRLGGDAARSAAGSARRRQIIKVRWGKPSERNCYSLRPRGRDHGSCSQPRGIAVRFTGFHAHANPRICCVAPHSTEVLDNSPHLLVLRCPLTRLLSQGPQHGSHRARANATLGRVSRRGDPLRRVILARTGKCLVHFPGSCRVSPGAWSARERCLPLSTR